MQHQYLVIDCMKIQSDHSYWSIITLVLLIHEHTYIL